MGSSHRLVRWANYTEQWCAGKNCHTTWRRKIPTYSFGSVPSLLAGEKFDIAPESTHSPEPRIWLHRSTLLTTFPLSTISCRVAANHQILLKKSVLAALRSLPMRLKQTVDDFDVEAVEARGPLPAARQEASLPYPLRASAISPFCANSGRWRLAGTHHLPH